MSNNLFSYDLGMDVRVNTTFRASPHLVNDEQEQVNQRVKQFMPSLPAKLRKQHIARGVRMAAQLMEGLGGGMLPVAGKHCCRHGAEEILGQFQETKLKATR